VKTCSLCGLTKNGLEFYARCMRCKACVCAMARAKHAKSLPPLKNVATKKCCRCLKAKALGRFAIRKDPRSLNSSRRQQRRSDTVDSVRLRNMGLRRGSYCRSCENAISYERFCAHREEILKRNRERRRKQFVDVSCKNCGEIFTPLTSRSVFCGERCYRRSRHGIAVKRRGQRSRRAMLDPQKIMDDRQRSAEYWWYKKSLGASSGELEIRRAFLNLKRWCRENGGTLKSLLGHRADRNWVNARENPSKTEPRACKTCGVVKFPSEFYETRDTLNGECKTCAIRRNVERKRARRLLARGAA
jgi:hypothetical protein